MRCGLIDQFIRRRVEINQTPNNTQMMPIKTNGPHRLKLNPPDPSVFFVRPVGREAWERGTAVVTTGNSTVIEGKGSRLVVVVTPRVPVTTSPGVPEVDPGKVAGVKVWLPDGNEEGCEVSACPPG